MQTQWERNDYVCESHKATLYLQILKNDNYFAPYIKSVNSQNYTHFTENELDIKIKHLQINSEQEYEFIVINL